MLVPVLIVKLINNLMFFKKVLKEIYLTLFSCFLKNVDLDDNGIPDIEEIEESVLIGKHGVFTSPQIKYN